MHGTLLQPGLFFHRPIHRSAEEFILILFLILILTNSIFQFILILFLILILTHSFFLFRFYEAYSLRSLMLWLLAIMPCCETQQHNTAKRIRFAEQERGRPRGRAPTVGAQFNVFGQTTEKLKNVPAAEK